MAKRGISLQSGGGNDDDNEEEKLLKPNEMNSSTLEWVWMRYEHSLLDNAAK